MCLAISRETVEGAERVLAGQRELPLRSVESDVAVLVQGGGRGCVDRHLWHGEDHVSGCRQTNRQTDRRRGYL